MCNVRLGPSDCELRMRPSRSTLQPICNSCACLRFIFCQEPRRLIASILLLVLFFLPCVSLIPSHQLNLHSLRHVPISHSFFQQLATRSLALTLLSFCQKDPSLLLYLYKKNLLSHLCAQEQVACSAYHLRPRPHHKGPSGSSCSRHQSSSIWKRWSVEISCCALRRPSLP